MREGRKHRQTSRLSWVFALLLALGWHAVWFVCLSPGAPHVLPTPRRFAAEVYFTPWAGAADRAPLDRTLDPLSPQEGPGTPSPEARAQPQARTGLPPAAAAVYLQRRSPGSRELLLITDKDLAERVADTRAPFVPTPCESSAFKDVGSKLKGALLVEISDGLDPAMFQVATVPEHNWSQFGRSWSVTAFLQIGDSGRVTHVFLETPAPIQKVNAVLVLALRAWRLNPGLGPRAGRVVFRYEM
ncbi:MAG: hypothetical protein JXR37_17890 [Kiritimatiellae bacterium]|nr:hypothetical protein [Kiritimatiellia bacterium]